MNFLARQVTSSLNQGNHKAIMVDENVNPNINRTSDCSNATGKSPSHTTIVKWREVKKYVRGRGVRYERIVSKLYPFIRLLKLLSEGWNYSRIKRLML